MSSCIFIPNMSYHGAEMLPQTRFSAPHHLHSCAIPSCTWMLLLGPPGSSQGEGRHLLLSPCHSSSCPGTVIGQSNTWDLILLKKCLKLEFGGCAGDGSAWHVVAGRRCWVCTSIWWYIYILSPRLCHTIKIAAFFSSTNTACMPHSIHIPQNARRCEVSG